MIKRTQNLEGKFVEIADFIPCLFSLCSIYYMESWVYIIFILMCVCHHWKRLWNLVRILSQ